jgi:hypothetical protein
MPARIFSCRRRDAFEQRLWTGWAAGDVDVDGDDPVDALEGGVVGEQPFRRADWLIESSGAPHRHPGPIAAE